MNISEIEKSMLEAVKSYDEKQSKKRYYNIFALSHYKERVADIVKDISKGADIRAAIVAGFSGALANAVLRKFKLPTLTKDESFGSGIYKPVISE